MTSIQDINHLLSQEAQTACQRWSKVCQNMLELLALSFPQDLANLLTSGELDMVGLTFGAEYMGKVQDEILVRDTLLPLLSHPSAIVREGAIYGVQNHMSQEIMQKLQSIAQTDLSPTIRQTARDALDEWEENQ